MITFDTIKFSIPFEILKRVQYQCFNHNVINSPVNGLELDKYVVKSPLLGIKDISISKMKLTATIELSAKILGYDYLNNISSNNFDDVLDQIKSTDLLYFKNDECKKLMKIHRVDASKNIILNDDIKPYINSLSLIANPKEYNFQNYKSQSITFSKNPLSKRRRLRFIFYDKYLELRRDKKFSSLFDVNRYRNVLRFEITLNNYYLMRKYLNIPKIYELNYYNVIENDTPLFKEVYTALYNSLGFNYDVQLHNIANSSLSAVEKHFGRKAICSSYLYDFKKVCIFLRTHVKGNLSKYYSEYKKYCIEKDFNPLINNSKNYLQEIYKNVA